MESPANTNYDVILYTGDFHHSALELAAITAISSHGLTVLVLDSDSNTKEAEMRNLQDCILSVSIALKDEDMTFGSFFAHKYHRYFKNGNSFSLGNSISMSTLKQISEIMYKAISRLSRVTRFCRNIANFRNSKENTFLDKLLIQRAEIALFFYLLILIL